MELSLSCGVHHWTNRRHKKSYSLHRSANERILAYHFRQARVLLCWWRIQNRGFNDSGFVKRTIQETSKSRCNNTDNNKTDISKTDPILSVRIRYERTADQHDLEFSWLKPLQRHRNPIVRFLNILYFLKNFLHCEKMILCYNRSRNYQINDALWKEAAKWVYLQKLVTQSSGNC